mmetsp:Transcript_8840/g.20288  ORF Transcript_8840/g.20288 Transcript_8840/m.20288 type:complete len:487 (-) Transcript_8840:744-2204(-)
MFAKSAIYVVAPFAGAGATSVKMDYLPIGFARVDPILSQDCLSDHVHTFYGPQSGVEPRRLNASSELEFHARLIETPVEENTGNVEENKSMYWHPTVYKYDRNSDTYTRALMAQSSAYYVWQTGETKAFPNGFQMIGGYDPELSDATASCSDPLPCDEDDCYTENSFFPRNKCSELEVSMRMPSCWDGVSINSPGGTGHVAYGDFTWPSGDDESFPDIQCPDSHPVKIPQIHLFFRISPYHGGWHTFSDGSSIFHADYVSGWNETTLQTLLDNCENKGDGAQPNHFCEDHLTFRDTPKCTNECLCDFADPILLEKIHAFQPATALDIHGTIADEETEVIVGNLPRGTCNGLLVGQTSGNKYNASLSANLKPPSTGEYVPRDSSEDEDESEDDLDDLDDGFHEDHEEEDEDGSGEDSEDHEEEHEEDEHEEDELTSFDEDPCYEDSHEDSQPVISPKSSNAASDHLAFGVLAFGSLSLWLRELGLIY